MTVICEKYVSKTLFENTRELMIKLIYKCFISAYNIDWNI